jgi:hypothetical protein|nr:MAG TPA: hypothetical protein [Caudoviricetes sp.]
MSHGESLKDINKGCLVAKLRNKKVKRLSVEKPLGASAPKW